MSKAWIKYIQDSSALKLHIYSWWIVKMSSYLESETDQSQYDLGTDLKVVICTHHFLKLLGQAHMLEDK